MSVAVGSPRVGELLRSWRQRRSLSQLELSLESEVSARHLSFIETGRARPSREMVLHLAERLDVPLRERNSLLLAAGFAPLYGERSLDSEEMTVVTQALDRFLRAHEPYPAVVVDRHWALVSANDALGVLLEGVAEHLLEPPANALRVALHPDGMAPRIINFDEWSSHLLDRLKRAAAITADPELEALYHELAGYPGVTSESPHDEYSANAIVLPLRLRHGNAELAFFGTVTTFGTPLDVTLSEIAVEAFYPANAATANALLVEVGAG
ncbi:MAG TPA: helix-turn-helix transcriptional regulator [Solirubrobacteraceae bacterium]|jgi:transcriptional regulator with XRE-family HTH domain|nr:helix-turn-helix transcriptional regulator [Solirubrobacteraceae bacterium]